MRTTTESGSSQERREDIFVALTKQDSTSGHVLVELSIGDSDAAFVNWIKQYALPPELFYSQPPPKTRWGVSNE